MWLNNAYLNPEKVWDGALSSFHQNLVMRFVSHFSVSGTSAFQNIGTFMAFSRSNSKRHVLFFNCCSCCSSVWSHECAFDATNSCEANLEPLLVAPQERGKVLQILFVLRYWKAQSFPPIITLDAASLSQWGGSGNAKSYPIPLHVLPCWPILAPLPLRHWVFGA